MNYVLSREDSISSSDHHTNGSLQDQKPQPISKLESARGLFTNPLKTGADFGVYNQYRLDSYFESQQKANAKVIKVASVQSHALHLEEQFLNFLQKYSKYQLVFIGLYGKKGCGKSLFLDKVLNLAAFEGSHFVDNKKKYIYLWSVPLDSQNSEMRVFLVDCVGYESEKQLSKEEEMLLDFLLFLCSQVTLLLSVKQFEAQMKQFVSASRFLAERHQRLAEKSPQQKVTQCYPNRYYIGFRNEEIEIPHVDVNEFLRHAKEIRKINLCDALETKHSKNYQKDSQKLKQVFLTVYMDSNKKLIKEGYLECLSKWIKQVSQDCTYKKLQQLCFNGKSLSRVLINLVQLLNFRKQFSIDALVTKTKKQLLAEAYNDSVKWYNRTLSKELGDENVKTTDQILRLFQKLYFKAFVHFRKKIKQTLIVALPCTQNDCEKLEAKLESYIRDKQKLVFQINKKKTVQKIRKGLEKIDIQQLPLNEAIEVRQVLYRTKSIERNLDCGRIQGIKHKAIEAWNKYIRMESEKEKQHIRELEDVMHERKARYEQLAEKNHQLKLRASQNISKFNQLRTEATEVNTKVENIKFEVMIQRNKNRDRLESSLEKIHHTAANDEQLLIQLKNYQKKLEEKYAYNAKQYEELRQDLEQAYELESSTLKKSPSVFMKDNNKDVTSVLKERRSFLQEKQQITEKEKREKQLLEVLDIRENNYPVSAKLLGSRIGKSENVRILRSRIDDKVRAEIELKQKLANSYVNLARVNKEYVNNKARSALSRKIQIKKKEQKLVGDHQNIPAVDKENSQKDRDGSKEQMRDVTFEVKD